MKQRIEEAMRRRHRKGDEGFTLIELLVVILIIAILAAVGIVALLSALRSGQRSAAKTSLRNAVTSVKSIQTGDGVTDFRTITQTRLDAQEPDITWVPGLTAPDDPNNVGFLVRATNSELVLQTQDRQGNYYWVLMRDDDSTLYAATETSAVPAGNTPTTTDNQWKEDLNDAWNDVD